MSFRDLAKGRESYYVSSILTVFRVVEVDQLRELFSYMKDNQFGRLMSRLVSEGRVYYSEDRTLVSMTNRALRSPWIEDKLNAFRVFLTMKDSLSEFVAGEQPVVVSVAGKLHDYDIIPATEHNLDRINGSYADTPQETVRLIASKDHDIYKRIVWRPKHDYFLYINENNEVEAHEM